MSGYTDEWGRACIVSDIFAIFPLPQCHSLMLTNQGYTQSSKGHSVVLRNSSNIFVEFGLDCFAIISILPCISTYLTVFDLLPHLAAYLADTAYLSRGTLSIAASLLSSAKCLANYTQSSSNSLLFIFLSLLVHLTNQPILISTTTIPLGYYILRKVCFSLVKLHSY